MSAAGKMPWPQALTGPLAGVTCLWQDIDGLHVEQAPQIPPPTSILWGWRPGTGYLVRVRLDGDTAYVAAHQAGQVDEGTQRAETRTSPDHTATAVLPWSPEDRRIAASNGRGPAATDGGVGTAYEQIIIEGIEEEAGPITFLRPAQ